MLKKHLRHQAEPTAVVGLATVILRANRHCESVAVVTLAGRRQRKTTAAPRRLMGLHIQKFLSGVGRRRGISVDDADYWVRSRAALTPRKTSPFNHAN